MLRRMMGIGLAAAAVFILMGAGLAKVELPKGPAGPKRTSVMKELQGEVTWISTPKDRIAIVFSRDEASRSEQEILLPIDKNIILHHATSLSDIGIGDTVSIQYEEVTEESAEGVKSRRTAKAIYFIRAAQKKPAPATVAAPEVSTSDDE